MKYLRNTRQWARIQDSTWGGNLEVGVVTNIRGQSGRNGMKKTSPPLPALVRPRWVRGATFHHPQSCRRSCGGGGYTAG